MAGCRICKVREFANGPSILSQSGRRHQSQLIFALILACWLTSQRPPPTILTLFYMLHGSKNSYFSTYDHAVFSYNIWYRIHVYIKPHVLHAWLNLIRYIHSSYPRCITPLLLHIFFDHSFSGVALLMTKSRYFCRSIHLHTMTRWREWWMILPQYGNDGCCPPGWWWNNLWWQGNEDVMMMLLPMTWMNDVALPWQSDDNAPGPQW